MGELGAFLQSADELIAAIAEDLGEEGPLVTLHGVKKSSLALKVEIFNAPPRVIAAVTKTIENRAAGASSLVQSKVLAVHRRGCRIGQLSVIRGKKEIPFLEPKMETPRHFRSGESLYGQVVGVQLQSEQLRISIKPERGAVQDFPGSRDLLEAARTLLGGGRICASVFYMVDGTSRKPDEVTALRGADRPSNVLESFEVAAKFVAETYPDFDAEKAISELD